MANKVAELYAEFRVNFQKSTLDLANTTLGQLRLGTLAEIASLAGLTRMLFNVGTHALTTASHLHMLGKVYGLNAQGLQNMERAGLAANVSTEKMESSILGLQQNLAALSLGRLNDSFLQAAGFFGLRVGPGMAAEDVQRQMFKAVPAFVKAHGAMGKSMAATLLGDMGMDPEMLQYFMGGKSAQKGQNVTERNIDALTATSEAMDTLGFDLKNLGDNSIAPLVDVLGPISGYLETIASVAGGVDNLAHPLRTAEGLGKSLLGAADEKYNYRTTAQQKQASDYLLKLHNAHPTKGFGGFLAQTFLTNGSKGGTVDNSSETTVHVHGSADSKTVKHMTQALKARDAKARSDYAGAAARYNPVEE